MHVVTTPAAGGAPDLLWRRFAETVGFAPEGLELPSPANESLTVQGARLLQEYGPALLAEVERTDALRAADPHAGCATPWCDRCWSTSPGEPIGVGPELRDRLLERGAESARQLRELGCRVTGDLDELAQGDDRPGARHPDTVTDAELVAAGRTLAVGQLRLQMAGPARASAGGARAGRRTGRRGERTRRWTFLVPSAYAAGGIARTISITANTLVGRGHEVTVVTLSRHVRGAGVLLRPAGAADPAARPLRPRASRPRPGRCRASDPRAKRTVRELDQQPVTAGRGRGGAQVVHRLRRPSGSRRSSRRCHRAWSSRPARSSASRPRCGADPDSILIHQEHLSFLPRPEPLRAALRRVATGAAGGRGLDALLTLTEADLERWRE